MVSEVVVKKGQNINEVKRAISKRYDEFAEFNGIHFEVPRISLDCVKFEEDAEDLFPALVADIEEANCKKVVFLTKNQEINFFINIIKANHTFTQIVFYKNFDNEEIAQINEAAKNNIYLLALRMPYTEEEKKSQSQKISHKNILSREIRVRNEKIPQGELILNKHTVTEILYVFNKLELKFLRSFTVINLSDNQLEDTFFEELNKIINKRYFQILTYINLSNNKFTEAVLVNLPTIKEKCPQLIGIGFVNNEFNLSVADYQAVINDNRLNKISLFGDSMKLFIPLDNNKEFFITSSFSIDHHFKYLSQTSIKILDFRIGNQKNIVSPDIFIKILDKLIERNSTITHLQLIGTKEYATGIKKLAEILNHKNCNLAYIDISIPYENGKYLCQGSPIDDSDIMPLLESLEKNKKLISLSLNAQKISAAIIEKLAKNLLENKTLTHLSLVDTEISQDGLKKLIPLLNPTKKKQKRNRSLRSLVISQKVDIVKKKDKNEYSEALRGKLRDYNETNKGIQLELKGFVEKGNLAEVKKLSVETSIYFRDDDSGNYLLHLAIKNKHYDVVKYFVKDLKYNLELTNEAGQTPLELALKMKRDLGANKDNNLDNIVQLLQNPASTPSKAKSSSSSKTTSTPTAKTAKRKNSDISDPNDSDNTEPPKKKTKHSQINTDDEDDLEDSDVSQADKSSKVKDDSEDEMKVDEESEIVIQDKSSSSSNSNEILFEYASTRNIYKLNEFFSKIRPNFKCQDRVGNSLYHIAVMNKDLIMVKLLLEKKIDCNLVNDAGESALACLVELLGNCYQLERDNLLLMAHELVKAGAGLGNYLFHKVVKMGDLRLMKIFLSSQKCDPNENDEEGHTPLFYAVVRKNLPLIERLLIDRRLTNETIEQAKEYIQSNIQNTNTSSSKNSVSPEDEKILALLTRYLEKKRPEPRDGIQWVKNHTLFYGSSSQKSFQINSDKEHAYLAMQNPYTKILLETDHKKGETPEEDLEKLGNPVTASLVFIVSRGAHLPHQSSEKIKIRISLDFIDTHHINKNEDLSEVKEKVKYRAESAPKEAFEGTFVQRNTTPLSINDIDEKDENKDPNFQLLLHHGEQSLLDDLERQETLNNIAQKLISHPKFVKKSKIYAVILELNTPLYPCENCEISLLGAQNADKSKFLVGLSKTLKRYECILPTFSPLRMVTQVSSYKVHKSSEKIEEKDHDELLVDIRSCNNNLILAKDESSFEPKLTLYHSNIGNL